MEVNVFVSYSHKDKAYLADGELLGFLRGLEKEGVSFWWDEALVVGDSFTDEIKTQIENTHIAVVLVSQWFLDSDYCSNVEVEEFLKHSKEKGLVIFPVILSPCEWRRHEWLKSRHFLPDEGQTVETDYSDAGRRKQLYLLVRENLRRQVEKIRRSEVEPKRDRKVSLVKIGVFVLLALLVFGLGVSLYVYSRKRACSDEQKAQIQKLADNIENNLQDEAPQTARELVEKARKICADYPDMPDWDKRLRQLEQKAGSTQQRP